MPKTKFKADIYNEDGILPKRKRHSINNGNLNGNESSEQTSSASKTNECNESPDFRSDSKLCCDNVDYRSFQHALLHVSTCEVKSNDNDQEHFCIPKKQYKEFFAKLVCLVLEEHWTLAKGKEKCLQWSEVESQWKTINAFVSQRVQQVSSSTIRVVRRRKFKNEFCANFRQFTVQSSKPDIALEIIKEQELSNAILIIEVRNQKEPESRADLEEDVKQLTVYMTTMQRPANEPLIELTERGLETHYQLHGLLIYRNVAYVVELQSQSWLDYAWSCVSINEYTFAGHGAVEVLRQYVRTALRDRTICVSQLFKLPNELSFPAYPANAEHLGFRENVVKVKWKDLAKSIKVSACDFSRLPLENNDAEVVVKVVSPTLYPFNGKEGTQLAGFEVLLYSFNRKSHMAEFCKDESSRQRLQTMCNLYLHIGSRGACYSSKVVVTQFKGLSVCSYPSMLHKWKTVLIADSTRLRERKSSHKRRARFFSEVCLTALDVVQYMDYVHRDIRPPNIVYNGRSFALIDWENGCGTLHYFTQSCKSTDQRYPLVAVPNHVIKWLVFTACQLFMCIYIIDKAALASDNLAEDTAIEIEQMFCSGGDWWNKNTYDLMTSKLSIMSTAVASQIKLPTSKVPIATASTNKFPTTVVSKSNLASKSKLTVKEWFAAKEHVEGWARDLLAAASQKGKMCLTKSSTSKASTAKLTANQLQVARLLADKLVQKPANKLPATELDTMRSVTQTAKPAENSVAGTALVVHSTIDQSVVNKVSSDKKLLSVESPEQTPLQTAVAQFHEWGRDRMLSELLDFEAWSEMNVAGCRKKIEIILRAALHIQ